MHSLVTTEVRTDIAPDILSLLKRVNHHLADRDITAYLVGGVVRDMVLGRRVEDIDIAVACDALEVASRVADDLDGKYVLLDEDNGVGRVVLSARDRKWELDFSTIEGGIEQDLARRDLTIDAMAIELEELLRNPQSPVLIDPSGGQEDCNRGVIKMVSDSAFADDPVRLLRAVRLAAELSFKIDKATEALIKRQAHLIDSVAGERVREELLRLLVLPAGGRHLESLEDLGLLDNIFPELVVTKGVTQPREHCWDVFEHSLRTVGAVDFLLREGNWEYAGREALEAVPWSVELAQRFSCEVGHGSNRKALLRLAALLHDIAKPQTKVVEQTGRTRFLGHPQEGALVVTDIMERLRFSTREIKLVEIMVRYHLRPTQMSHEGLPTNRAIYRYFRDSGEAGIDILFLSLADHLATRGENFDIAHWREHAEIVAHVLARHAEEETLTASLKLVDGHDLINLYGLRPGPNFAEILEAVREAQAAGEVTTREEALQYIQHTLNISLRKDK
jgi:poly(A) polymerase